MACSMMKIDRIGKKVDRNDKINRVDKINRNTELNLDTVTFGKYKDRTLKEVLKDRSYCAWLLKQDWFKGQYEYLYNRVKEYDPLKRFIHSKQNTNVDFLSTYTYFNMRSVESVFDKTTDIDYPCYQYYYDTIRKIKKSVKKGCFDIKTPSKWLQQFEEKYNLPRTTLKEFLSSNGLANITSIIEDVRKHGNMEYKGAKAFLIAKENSSKQEHYWGEILSKVYHEHLGTQYKYNNCFFDFLVIRDRVIYECKLSIANFNEEQYNKYLIALEQYKIVYLINTDCIIDMQQQILFTINSEKYRIQLMCYRYRLPEKRCKFGSLIMNFQIVKINNMIDYFLSFRDERDVRGVDDRISDVVNDEAVDC